MHYKAPTREKTPPNQQSKSPFTKNIFQNPLKQSKTASSFPTTTVNTGFNPFGQHAPQIGTTPQIKSICQTNPTSSLFTATNPLFRPLTPPKTATTSLFPQKPAGVNPQQVQAEVSELLQLKKDNQLQKQMIEQTLIRIKELQAKNFELQNQKTQFLQRNILLQNTINTYQQQANLVFQTPNQHYNPKTQMASMQPVIQPIKPIKQNPIHFDHSKKNQLFAGQLPPSVLNEDDIMPKAWTQKTFLTTDGYAFQAFVAFNAFYAVKYIILQKLKNDKGYLDLNESLADNLSKESKEKRSARWHLYHQNSGRNVIPHQCIEHLTQILIKQMTDNDSTPINIKIELSKYLSIEHSKCTVFHPDWTISNPFQLQLYDFNHYNSVNQETKNIMKKNIAEWIMEKSKQQTQKKTSHQLLMWFNDTKGIFHLIWK